MKYLKKTLVASLILAWSVGPALACINDRETYRQERQFKALYPDTPGETPSPHPEASPVSSPVVTFGPPLAGVALLSGAAYLGLTRRIL